MKVRRERNPENLSKGNLSFRNSSRDQLMLEKIERKRDAVTTKSTPFLERSRSDKEAKEILNEYRVSRQKKAAEITSRPKDLPTKDPWTRRPPLLSSRVVRLKLLLNIHE